MGETAECARGGEEPGGSPAWRADARGRAGENAMGGKGKREADTEGAREGGGVSMACGEVRGRVIRVRGVPNGRRMGRGRTVTHESQAGAR